MKFRQVVTIPLCLILVWQPISSSAQDRSQYQQQTRDVYIPAAQGNADNLKPTVEQRITTSWNNQNPPYYGGNSFAGVAAAETEDLWAILSDDLLDCLDMGLRRGGYSWRRGWKYTFDYNWPIQTIHAHRFWQNRHIPDIAYRGFDITNYIKELYYPMVNDIMVPATVALASGTAYKDWVRRAQATVLPLVQPVVLPGASNTNLATFGKKGRYTGGSVGADGHLEYYVGPTLIQALLAVIATYFPLLKWFLELSNCFPPTQLPFPFTSEDPVWLGMTRNWLLSSTFYNDQDLYDDLLYIADEPAVCARKEVSQNAVPTDMYDIPLSPTNPLPLTAGKLISPLSSQELSQNIARLNRVCTNKIGQVMPFTTLKATATHDIAHAQISFEKAIRFGWGIYLTILRQNTFPRTSDGYRTRRPGDWAYQWNTPAESLAFYNLDKTGDQIQFVYHDDAPRNCHRIGEIAPKFSEANTYRKPGEEGMYTMIHWKKFECSFRTFMIIPEF